MWGDKSRKFSLHFVSRSQPTSVSELYSVNNLPLIHITRTCSPSLMRRSVLNVPVAWHISLVADNFLTVPRAYDERRYKRIFPAEKLLPEEVYNALCSVWSVLVVWTRPESANTCAARRGLKTVSGPVHTCYQFGVPRRLGIMLMFQWTDLQL
jgi:hypothetical protein